MRPLPPSKVYRRQTLSVDWKTLPPPSKERKSHFVASAILHRIVASGTATATTATVTTTASLFYQQAGHSLIECPPPPHPPCGATLSEIPHAHKQQCDAVQETDAGQIPTGNLLEHQPNGRTCPARSGNIKRCCCYLSRTQRVGAAEATRKMAPPHSVDIDATSVFAVAEGGGFDSILNKKKAFAHPPTHSNDITNSPVPLFLKLVTRQIRQHNDV